VRIWSVHPRFLDRQGLLGCWRETLLAQAVLAGDTRGYTRHPQLERFRAAADPMGAVGAYLRGLADDGERRGYRLDRRRIRTADSRIRLEVAIGQLEHEWLRLGAKLEGRSPAAADAWRAAEPQPHPLFQVVPGGVAGWERG